MIRVVTWNIHGCVGADRRFDPDRTARVLAALAPDVALLQEVGDARGVHPPFDQAAALADATGMTSTLGVTLPRDPYGYGNVTLTRLARTAAATYDLSVRGFEPRVCLCVEVAAPANLLTANVHFGLSRRERRRQLATLFDELGPLGGAPAASLVAGDFNDWPAGPVTRAFAAQFRDATPASARTFPSRLPLLGLDRIYLAGAIDLLEARVDASAAARAASDHLPVIADLALQKA
jgi:endonuclease/exonuclease/phosphatase family metal-dependent hydrolase